MNRILTAIILSLFVVTGYITYLVHERQSELQKFTRYTDSWSMSQMVSEYMRLESRLAGMAIGAEGADHDEVRLRLEIMMSFCRRAIWVNLSIKASSGRRWLRR